MFNSDFPVRADKAQPFPHSIIEPLFDSAAFADLAATYPECPPASGPTGHTIHRGDPQFDNVMANHAPWRAFFERCNSQVFLDTLTAMFAGEIFASCKVASTDFRFVDHIESRQDKEAARFADPALPPEAIFMRFDFMQGMRSYARRPHLDHRRRLATMLVYFDGPGPETFEGGDLVLHDLRGSPASHVAPAANRAVLFPCSERSWHSVDPVTRCDRPRRFVQIAASSCHDIWPTRELPARTPLDWGRKLVKRLF